VHFLGTFNVCGVVSELATAVQCSLLSGCRLRRNSSLSGIERISFGDLFDGPDVVVRKLRRTAHAVDKRARTLAVLQSPFPLPLS
jgi:hypothetical protein